MAVKLLWICGMILAIAMVRADEEASSAVQIVEEEDVKDLKQASVEQVEGEFSSF